MIYPAFDEIAVISDLHIGGPADQQIFREGELLGKFIDYLRNERSGTRALVINGDMVDFLAEENARYFDADGAITKLEGMRRCREFAPVWNALVEFTKNDNCHLAITLGNHDLELALPWVRQKFLEMLSGGNPQAQARITLAFDGSGFACKVGGASVLCVHGNEVDTWNVTDFEALRRHAVEQVIQGNNPDWTPNAGTKLVIDVMNEIKKNHAFVDVLKPETGAALKVLYALKPKLKSKLLSIAAIATRRVWDAGRRSLRLLSDATDLDLNDDELRVSAARQAIQAKVDAETLMARVEEQFNAGADPLDLVHVRQAEQLGWFSELTASAFRGKPHEVAWEGVKELGADTTFEIRRVDADYDKIDALASAEYKYVLAGHTHLARSLERRNRRGMYYNTGTWATLMRLMPDQLRSAEKFEHVFERLKQAKTIQQLGSDLVFTRPTVAMIQNRNGQTESSLKKVVLKDDKIDLVDIGDAE